MMPLNTSSLTSCRFGFYSEQGPSTNEPGLGSVAIGEENMNQLNPQDQQHGALLAMEAHGTAKRAAWEMNVTQRFFRGLLRLGIAPMKISDLLDDHARKNMPESGGGGCDG